MPISDLKEVVLNILKVCYGKEKHLQKTMQILPSAVAEARASVWIFYLLIVEL